MPCTSNEARVILALQALQNNEELSVRKAAKIYNVDRMTLLRRRTGKPVRRDTIPNSRRLTDSEEKAIVQYVLELDERAFLLRLSGMEDIANQLLRERDAPPIGKRWAYNFVIRQPDIQMH